MDDMNNVILEGIIFSMQEIKETNGKKVLNFIVENTRKTKLGEQNFKYACVAWDKTIEKFQDRIKLNSFVRIVGHLQDSVLKTDTMSDFHYIKICVDHMDVAY